MGFPASKLPAATDQRYVRSEACGAVRTILAGGDLMKLINHPSVTPLERIFRRNPLPGAFTATPEEPFSFELGALEIPKQMSLVLLEYRFAIYVPSGIVAGDTLELEDRRLSTSVGYDVLFSEKRPDNVRYELTPSDPTTLATETFQAQADAGTIPGGNLSPVTAATFQRLRADNRRATISSALSTLPQRHRRDAQLDMPFTYIVNSNQRVNLQVRI
ncbi:MAG: hypothetical protein ACE5FJ_05580, partial [Gemmatimonadales bacterium]